MVKLKSRKRQVAHKIWMKNILDGNFVKQEGWEPNYIEFDGRQISRINVVATVVSKFISEDGNYGSITLDDGTETIRAKAFGPDVVKITPMNTGSIVRFIGKIKEYNDELYLSIEIVRKLEDPNWIIVHRLETGVPDIKVNGVKPSISESVAEEKIKEEDTGFQKNILDFIRAKDDGNGVEMACIITECKLEEEEAKNVIIGLLKSGDIFEPRKGKLRVLD